MTLQEYNLPLAHNLSQKYHYVNFTPVYIPHDHRNKVYDRSIRGDKAFSNQFGLTTVFSRQPQFAAIVLGSSLPDPDGEYSACNRLTSQVMVHV
jgi:hypothetical protein